MAVWWMRKTEELEQAESLDRVVDAVTAVVARVLPPGRVKDSLHGTWLGHAVHPLLVALPIGMFSGATLLDVAGGRESRTAARRLVGAGVLLVAPTAATGLADWSALGAFRQPRRVGLVHAAANALTAAVYAASWWARVRGDHALGRRLAMAGALGLSVGGYLGGHLAYSEGVAVNRNADRSPAPTEWTDAAAVADVVPGELHRVEVEGQPVVLARQGGDVLAIGAVCSHYGAPLEDGELTGGSGGVDGGACVVCPWHGSVFRMSDGSVVRGPATAPQPSFEVRVVGDRVQIRAA
jgi:nitrite reductase/ring-hydroxylating ferredoxin subunit/uncharacterized membrane protein